MKKKIIYGLTTGTVLVAALAFLGLNSTNADDNVSAPAEAVTTVANDDVATGSEMRQLTIDNFIKEVKKAKEDPEYVETMFIDPLTRERYTDEEMENMVVQYEVGLPDNDGDEDGGWNFAPRENAFDEDRSEYYTVYAPDSPTLAELEELYESLK